MDHEKDTGSPSDGRDLGTSFDEHTSHNPGSSFAAHTSSPPDHRYVASGARRRRVWIWIGILILIALALFLVYRNSKDTSASQAGGKRGQTGPAAITVGQSKTGDINIYVDALGTVTPLSTVTIYSQITGLVQSVHYREGQIVHKGDPLIDIDPRPYQATLAQAKGSLQHDEGVLAQARIDLQRYRDAYARNAIAKQQLDDQEQAVVQDEGTVAADKGTVQYDEVQLSYCHIVSPINGRVGLRLVDPGNTVFSGSGSTLVVITQLQPITVVFNVSEDSLPEVQAQLHGKTVLEVDAYDRSDDKELEAGKLTSLNNEIDTTTGTVKFRGEFPNKDLVMFPNQFVNARLLVRTLKNATLVPSAAVQHNGTAAFVYVVSSDNKVAVQPVTAVTNNDTETAVEGIGPGVSLATSGFDRLENGVEVTVRGQGSQKSNGSKTSTGGTTSPSTTGTQAP